MIKKQLFGKYGQFLVHGSAVACLVLVLSACNTFEGVGKDVRSTGKGVEEAAENSK